MARLQIATIKELCDRFGLNYNRVRNWNARLKRIPEAIAKHPDQVLARAAKNANRAIVRERKKAVGL